MHLPRPFFKEAAHYDKELRGETERGDWNSELSDCISSLEFLQGTMVLNEV